MRTNVDFRLRFMASMIGVFCFVLFIPGKSQNTGTSTKFDSTFNSFKTSITSDFERFQNKNDSVFLEFLQNAWKEYNLMKDSSRIKIKPKIQPRVQSLLQMKSIDKMDTIEQFKGTWNYEIHNEPIPEKDSYKVKSTNNSFEFYGEKNDLPEVPDIHLNDPIDNFSIISFYRSYLKDPGLAEIAVKLKMVAKNLRLNDFGYYLLIQKASQRLFRDVNDQILYTWISLLRSGLDVKVGYTKNDIILLMDCDNPLYNTNYIRVEGVNYYLIHFPDQGQYIKSLHTYDFKYAGKASPVSIQIKELPAFSDKPETHAYIFHQDTIKIDINLFLIDYLGNYPACELKLYFNTPFSEKALFSLDRKLRPLLSGKSETEKVNTLLSFIQKSFPYKTDQDQFGREKYMFCDEAVYYPYTDCDDRSVLFARLVRHYTGLDAIGLDYPDHVSVGVRFTTPFKGDYILYNDSKFFICDPTYIGALAGMAMDEMKTLKPEVIPVNN
jgi:hypothetical protein